MPVEQEAEQVVETPTDSPAKPRRKRPVGGNRYRLNAKGDYTVYQIAPPDSGMPPGTLLPIPGVPKFPTSEKTQAWVEKSGDKLSGMQIAILKFVHIGAIAVETIKQVSVQWKPRTPVTGPAATEEGGE